MSVIQVGLVDKTGKINPELIQSVAAALTIQATRDLPQFWNVQASVSYVSNPSKIPAGVWPVFLMASLPPGEGGFHQDKHNQPYAEVIASPESDEWTIDASHEIVEMLVDPSGNRLQPSTSIGITGGKIEDTDGQFSYLVEACDPCEADQYAYSIQGVAVSDFITPHFYDPTGTSGARYSFTGKVTRPRDILPGGYITWVDQENDAVQQLRYLTSKPQIITLGTPQQVGLSLRAWVDSEIDKSDEMKQYRSERHKHNADILQHCRTKRGHLDRIAAQHAKLYQPKHRSAGNN
jgi:hypothetical protein